MNISQIMEKMIAFSNGNLHDMNHFMCVWTYAKTIGELEGLDRKTQETLEIAAITHDIACPLCREKYGNTNGKRQEEEGGPLVRSFLVDAGLSVEQVDRVAYLVSHHHTYTDIDGIDYQILIEAGLHRKRLRKRLQPGKPEKFPGKAHENRKRKAPPPLHLLHGSVKRSGPITMEPDLRLSIKW